MYHGVHAKVLGQLLRVSSFLLPCGSQESNSSCRHAASTFTYSAVSTQGLETVNISNSANARLQYFL